MNDIKATMAQQVATAVSEFQLARTGHAPRSVTVVLGEGTLVVTSGLALGPLPLLGSGNYAVHMDHDTTIQLETTSWTSNRQLELVSGMANVDVTNGVAIVRNGSIFGGGTMNTIGKGTLIINNSGANVNTYTGGTIVENGFLQVNNTAGSATGSGTGGVSMTSTASRWPTSRMASPTALGCSLRMVSQVQGRSPARRPHWSSSLVPT